MNTDKTPATNPPTPEGYEHGPGCTCRSCRPDRYPSIHAPAPAPSGRAESATEIFGNIVRQLESLEDFGGNTGYAAKQCLAILDTRRTTPTQAQPDKAPSHDQIHAWLMAATPEQMKEVFGEEVMKREVDMVSGVIKKALGIDK